MENFKGKGVIKWALSIGIIIVLNLFFSAAIQVAYPEPQFNDFCESYYPVLKTGEVPVSDPAIEQARVDCSNVYQEQHELYARNVFGILVFLGALSLVAGFALRISPAVSAGLSYGGVLSFIIAAIRYWGEAGDLVRLAIVAAALVALIAIGVKKFKE